MKKLLLILSILFYISAYSQTRSATSGFSPRANQTFVVEDGNFSARNSLFTPRFLDTLEAATYIQKDTIGNVIYLYSTHSLWVRTIASGITKKWTEIGSGGGSGTLTSAAMTVPSFLSVSGSPITTSGTFAVTLSGTALPAINGGTGQVSYAVGDLLYASTTTALSKLAASTSGFVLTANGAGVAPSWQAIPSDNLIVQNAGSGTQTWFTSGDTLYMKMIKNATVSATTDTDSSLLLNVTNADYGDITVTNIGATWTIGNDVVTFAKFQNITQARLLGRYTASTGDMQEISIGSGLALDAGTGVLSATGGGSGDVTKVGTPVNNQLGVWTGDGTIEGDANLTFASSTLSIGVAGSATGIFTQSGVTSGIITFQPASAAGTYTLTWPTNDGDADQVLTTNGSGVLSWTTSAGGGANTALSNLAAVAINTSLISDADVTDDLGDATHNWDNVYLRSALFDGSTSGTITLQATATAGTNTITLPASTSTVAVLGLTQTWTQDQIYSGATIRAQGGIWTNSAAATSNFAVVSSSAATTQTAAQLIFAGATTIYSRVISRSSASTTLGTNSSYGGWVIGDQGVTEASSGTHALLSAFVIKGSAITGGAGATTDLATVYIEGLMTGVTPTAGTYSLWVDAGTARLDGGILGTTTNDAATAGNIGEEVVAIQSTYTNYTTTATYQNITSITLTAGDWDLSAFMTYSSNSATITAASNAIFVISTTTASAAGATEGRNIGYVPQAALLGTSLFSESISPYRVSIASTTTYYLNTQATFTLGNPQYVGGLRGRRIR